MRGRDELHHGNRPTGVRSHEPWGLSASKPLPIRAHLPGKSLGEQELSMSVNHEAAHLTRSGSAPPDPRRWRALALLAIADFVVILDATIVNVALPSIG